MGKYSYEDHVMVVMEIDNGGSILGSVAEEGQKSRARAWFVTPYPSRQPLSSAC